MFQGKKTVLVYIWSLKFLVSKFRKSNGRLLNRYLQIYMTLSDIRKKRSMLYINNLLVTIKLYIHANVWWNNFYVACLTPCTVPPCYLKLRKKKIYIRRFEINWLNQRLNICDFHVADFPNIEVHMYYIIIHIFTCNIAFFMLV